MQRTASVIAVLWLAVIIPAHAAEHLPTGGKTTATVKSPEPAPHGLVHRPQPIGPQIIGVPKPPVSKASESGKNNTRPAASR